MSTEDFSVKIGADASSFGGDASNSAVYHRNDGGDERADDYGNTLRADDKTIRRKCRCGYENLRECLSRVSKSTRQKRSTNQRMQFGDYTIGGKSRRNRFTFHGYSAWYSPSSRAFSAAWSQASRFEDVSVRLAPLVGVCTALKACRSVSQ